jgi:hypothetical protein
MSNVISDERFLEELRDELLDEICYEKNNDLYKFHQVYVFRFMCLLTVEFGAQNFSFKVLISCISKCVM